MKRIEIDTLPDPASRKIVRYLEENEATVFGEIVRDLNLSVNRAQQAVHWLVEEEIVGYSQHPKHVQLIVDVR
jgi:predicted transcriptional regulator